MRNILAFFCFIVSILSSFCVLIHFVLWFCKIDIATRFDVGQLFFIALVSFIFGIVGRE